MPIQPSWIQAGSTVVLVLVTGFYALQTHRTNNVMHEQFKKERQRFHTNVLKDRVEDWLEELPRVFGADIEVPGTDVAGHPAIDESVDGPEGHLWVRPLMLRDDPYFKDLIENHAQELDTIASSIEDLFEEFWELRSMFLDSYSDTEPLDVLDFRADPTDYYELWAFERAVRLKRGPETKEGLYDILEQGIKNDKSALNPPTKRFPGDNTERGVVECDVVKNTSLGEIKLKEGSEEEIIEALRNVIDRLSEQEEYEYAKEAAVVLNEIEDEIDRLEQKLTEYKGKEIYEGECEYVVTLD